MRCSVCGRWLGRTRYHLADDDAPPAHVARRWLVCAVCKEAVEAEVNRAGLGSPARLRVAIGMVATSRRRSRARIWDDDYWEHLSDAQINRLLIWLFVVAFVVHAVAFLAVAVYVSFVH